MGSVRVVVIFGALLCVGIASSTASSYDDDVTLTLTEKKALDKFKQLVIPKIPATSYIQNYKADDLYFIRWLRAKSLNVEAAEAAFLRHLKWREEEHIDTIDAEDWSEFKRDYPVFHDTVDKDGSPTCEIFAMEWNPRRAVLAGKNRTLRRWLIRMMELLNRQVYSARAKGKRISQGVIICGMEEFNVVQFVCPACLAIYVNTILTYDTHYPSLFKNVYILDVPPAFEIIWRVIRPVMSRELRAVVAVHANKEEWMQLLESRFDKDQRSSQFGGTISRDI